MHDRQPSLDACSMDALSGCSLALYSRVPLQRRCSTTSWCHHARRSATSCYSGVLSRPGFGRRLGSAQLCLLHLGPPCCQGQCHQAAGDCLRRASAYNLKAAGAAEPGRGGGGAGCDGAPAPITPLAPANRHPLSHQTALPTEGEVAPATTVAAPAAPAVETKKDDISLKAPGPPEIAIRLRSARRSAAASSGSSKGRVSKALERS